MSTANPTRTTLRIGSALMISALVVASCGSPTTLAQVCADFRELNEEIDSDTLPGLFDNHIFDQIDDLGGTASRYEGGGDIVTAGQALKDLADRDSLSIDQIYRTADPIEVNC